MENLITTKAEEFQELIGMIDCTCETLRECSGYRPRTIGGMVYLSGEELMERLHISKRTLQNLRDNNIITYTTLGGKFLYPETTLQKLLEDNYRVP